MMHKKAMYLLIIMIFFSECSCSVPTSTGYLVNPTPSSTYAIITVFPEATPQPTQLSDEQKYQQALNLYNQGRYYESSLQFAELSSDGAQKLSEDARKRMILAPVLVDGRWGYIDNFQNIVITPQFDDAKPFVNGRAIVCKESDWYFIDPEGTNIGDLSGNWFAVGPFIDGIACFQQMDENGLSLYGCINHSGTIVFGAYSTIPIYFIDGLAMITYRNLDYYLDMSGNLYSRSSMVTETLPGHKSDLYSSQWKIFMGGICGNYSASKVTLFSEPKPDFSTTLFGYLYPDGSYAITPKFLDAGMFIEGLAPVRDVNGKWGFIDRFGNYIIEPIYEHALRFSQGLAAVKTDGKYGYIDKSGKMVIKPQYYDVTIFREGLAGIKVTKTQNYEGWGFINKAGKIVIKPSFGSVDDNGFMGGYCVVSTSVKSIDSDKIRYGVIDKNGKWKIKPKYRNEPSAWPGGIFADNYILFDGTKGFIQYDTELNNHGEITGSIVDDRNPNRFRTFTFCDNGYITKPSICNIPDDYDEDRPSTVWNLIKQGVLGVGDLEYQQGECMQGMTLYSDGALYGFKDCNGNVVIKAMYQGAGPFGSCSEEYQ